MISFYDKIEGSLSYKRKIIFLRTKKNEGNLIPIILDVCNIRKHTLSNLDLTSKNQKLMLTNGY